MNTINSSSLSWEIFPNKDGSITYCADGDGFVTVEQITTEHGITWYHITESQGEPVADLEDVTLLEALEIAQNYLAATYNGIFQAIRI